MVTMGENTEVSGRDCVIWARVSTLDQHAENQLPILRKWARDRGLNVVAEFITEDSAWQTGKIKGAEFDRARKDLIEGTHRARWSVVLTWAIDRLSRKGVEDTLACMRQIYETDADVWSWQEPWLRTSEPHMRELLVSIFAWMAKQESDRRSERIRAGLARRKAEGKPVGGRKPGSKDRKRRDPEPYRRAALERTQAR
jgi:putative DNA-invertase from lambdoid prophage Rac